MSAGHGATPGANLLGGPPPTLLPADTAIRTALDEGTDPQALAAAHPATSLPWAALAERALDEDQSVTGYAFARTGYHRGLDALRRAGWRGHGPVPWSHEPNRGFLQALAALGRAAAAIGEHDERDRVLAFLHDCDPSCLDVLDVRNWSGGAEG